MNKVLLNAEQIVFGYKNREILKEITLALSAGEILGIIGPNGSGKSTLLKVLAGIVSPWRGEVSLQGRPLSLLHRRDIARIIATVAQETAGDFPFKVRELVAMGRAPYQGRFALEGKRDRAVIEEVMALTDVTPFADRFPNELSGGERQRVIIARALAQEPDILLLDEPTSYLDLHHQIEINSLIMKLKREKEVGVIYVTHDLNSAALCCDRLVMMGEGKIMAEGLPGQVMTTENIQRLYGCAVLVDENPQTGRPRITPQMEVCR